MQVQAGAGGALRVFRRQPEECERQGGRDLHQGPARPVRRRDQADRVARHRTQPRAQGGRGAGRLTALERRRARVGVPG